MKTQKKKNSKLLLFVLFVVGVVGYAGFDYYWEQRSEEKKAEGAQVLQLKADQIGEIHIQSTAQPVNLQREKDGWVVVRPSQKDGASTKERADQNAVQSLLDFLTKEKSTGTAQEGSSIDFKIYGLDAPAATVLVKDNAGQTQKYEIGTKKNFEGRRYLRRNGESKVWIVSTEWEGVASKKIFDFQDKRLVKFPMAEVQKIWLAKKTGSPLEFVLKENTWSSVQKPEHQIEQNKIRELLTSLQTAEATEFLSEGAPAPDQVKTLNLSSPELTFTLERKNGERWMGQFFKSKDGVHTLKTGDPVHLLRVAPQQVEALAKVSLEDLRDKRQAFSFNKNDVKKIELVTELKKVSLEKNSESQQWTLSPPEEGTSLKQEAIELFLSKLRNTEVAEFLGPRPLGTSERQVALKKENGELLFKLGIGALQTKKVEGADQKFYLVKTNFESELLSVKESEINNLQLEDILNTKEKQNP